MLDLATQGQVTQRPGGLEPLAKWCQPRVKALLTQEPTHDLLVELEGMAQERRLELMRVRD